MPPSLMYSTTSLEKPDLSFATNALSSAVLPALYRLAIFHVLYMPPFTTCDVTAPMYCAAVAASMSVPMVNALVNISRK